MALRRGRRARWALLAGLGLTVVVVVMAVLVVTTQPPPLAVTSDLAASVLLPGSPPALAWPGQGQAAVEVDGLGTLGTYGSPAPRPIASVAKMMTAYVVLLDHPLPATGAGGLSVTISAADAADAAARRAQGQSTVAVAAGEVLTEDQALEGLLLPSGNNVAAVLADADAGSEAAFVAKMNAAAKDLGMSSTTYTDPSGFTPTTTSTASDQLLLASAAMSLPDFARIVALPEATLPVAGVLKNYNTLVGTDGFVGVKTGSESSSGGCLVFVDERTISGVSVRIVGAVLGQDQGTATTSVIVGAALAASRQLADSVTASLSVRPVLPAGSRVATVTNADGRTVAVTTASGLTRFGYGGQRVALHLELPSPGLRLAADQQVGTVSLGSEPGAPSTPAVARARMPGTSWSWRLHHAL